MRTAWKMPWERPPRPGAEPAETLPPEGWDGYLDHPSLEGAARGGLVEVQGWLVCGGSAPVSLTARLGEGEAVELRLGIPRPDVVRARGGYERAALSGFSGIVPAASRSPQPLRVEARLEDGRTVLAFRRQVRFADSGGSAAAPRGAILGFASRVRSVLRGALGALRRRGPRLAAPERRPGSLRVLFVTHSLNLEGAPIWAFELARHMARCEGFTVLTVAPSDGPLRARYEAAGLALRIAEEEFPPAEGAGSREPRLRELARGLRAEGGAFDVACCSTLWGFWGLELAELLGAPAVWHLHESVIPPGFKPTVARGFELAARVHVPSRATARAYASFDADGKLRALPHGIGVRAIQEHRARADKAALRRALGLPEGGKVVAIVGTTCERKGQHVFIEAARLLLQEFPEGVAFLLAGGRPGVYLDMLRRQIRSAGERHFRLVMETPDILDCYAASDIFVCASFEEALPLVVMEAMAFGLPIVSTNVFGIPELLAQGEEGLLVEPGRPEALAREIGRLLRDPALAGRLGASAAAAVQERSEAGARYGAQAELCREAAALSRTRRRP